MSLGPPRPHERRRVPFLGHSVAEYVLAAALIASGVHASGAAELLLVVVGAALVVLNAATAGPLSAFRLLSRRAHHAGDLVVIAALVVSPLVELHRFHLLGLIAAEVVALVLLRIERTTRYADPPRGARRGRAVPARAVRAGPDGAGPEPARPGERAAAGRPASGGSPLEGAGALAASLAPVAGRAARTGAHRLGVVAGVTRRVIREKLRPGPRGGPSPPLTGPDRAPRRCPPTSVGPFRGWSLMFAT